jgi:filamentous hemagglutinin family protein
MSSRPDSLGMTQNCNHQARILGLAFFLAMSGGILLLQNRAWAQAIAPDNTLREEHSIVRQGIKSNGEIRDLIEGGARRQANLFHSFEKFNVGEGQNVYFVNPDGVKHIFSRVTGNSSSNILGKLGVLGHADLFLLNPHGIIFGPNTQLDVKGSFIASTADSIVFDNDVAFSASNPQVPPLLTINLPIGLRFGVSPGNIVNSSRFFDPEVFDIVGLRVPSGKTLALVGGDITNQGGFFTAFGGRIELGSVAAGQVSLKKLEAGDWTLGYEGIQSFRDIRLLQASYVNTSGEGGGNIQLRGRSIAIADGSRVFATVNEGSKPGGTLRVTASDSVELAGTNSTGEINSLLSTGTLFSEGKSGTLVVNTRKLIVRDRAGIQSISILTEPDSGPVIRPEGTAGDITINAEVVEIGNNAYLSSSTFGAGKAGNITLNTKQLSLTGGGRIEASTGNLGKGGDILINAANGVVTLSGVSSDTGNSSGLFTTTEEGAGNEGGKITVRADSLSIADGAVINARTRSGFRGGDITVQARALELARGGQILTTTFSRGSAGDIKINRADNITLVGSDPTFASRLKKFGAVDNISSSSGLFADTVPDTTGAGGNIFLEARQIAIQNQAGVAVDSKGSGDAGNIQLQAHSLTLDNRAFLSAETTSSRGGNITLQSKNLVLLRRNSKLTTEASGNGSAGSLTVNTPQLTLQQGSEISASTQDGTAGNLTVNADKFVQLNQGRLE